MGKEGKGDPRKKTTDAKRKLKQESFGEWFEEIIEAQGAPYASAWAKYKDSKAVVFRSKVLARVWDVLESTESDYDSVTPRIEDIQKTQMHRTKLAPIRVFHNNKLVRPEDYDDTISCTDLCYITGTMKIVHSRYVALDLPARAFLNCFVSLTYPPVTPPCIAAKTRRSHS